MVVVGVGINLRQNESQVATNVESANRKKHHFVSRLYNSWIVRTAQQVAATCGL